MMAISRRRAGAALLSLGLSVLAATAQAEYLWIERDPGQPARAYLSDFQPDQRLPLGRLLEAGVNRGGGKGEPVAATGDAFVLDTAAAGDLRLTAKAVEADGLVIYEAKEGRGETRALNDLELVPTEPGGNTFTLHWKGTVVAASQVNVYTSAQWTRALKPAADGSVTLTPDFPARYVLEVAAQINGAATVDGKRYDKVTHVATLSFRVPRP